LVEEVLVEEVLVDEVLVDEVLVEEVLVEEVLVEEVLIDEVLVDEAESDEVLVLDCVLVRAEDELVATEVPSTQLQRLRSSVAVYFLNGDDFLVLVLVLV
jgi:hypothetical protein